MLVDFPNIVRLPKLHFAANTSFVLEHKTHQHGPLQLI